MKPKILSAAFLAAAGLTLAPGLARAAEPNVPATTADLILGFQLSGYNDLEVNIGPISQYLSDTSVTPVTFGVIPADQTGAGTTVTSLNADLSANFGGSGWNTNSLLYWGVAGESTTGNTVFLTVDSNNPIPQRPSTSGAGQPVDLVGALINDGLSGSPSTVNSTDAASVATSTADSWDSFNPSTSAFQTGLNIEEAPGDSATGSTLDLYELAPNGRNGGGNGQEIGSFSLNAAGDLTYTPAAVPEPSTWASIIGGALFLGLFRLRRGIRAS